jgi:hypothetical protein
MVSPTGSVSPVSTQNNGNAYTVCFSGTCNRRDQGEASDKNDYCSDTGYIPVRLHTEISGALRQFGSSVTIRGVAEDDWENTPKRDALKLDGPLKPHQTLIDHTLQHPATDKGALQPDSVSGLTGRSDATLALHAANLALGSGRKAFNFIGHSRGAVECVLAAWFIYLYGSKTEREYPINIFAIDPVPGPGNWYSLLTQLPPNVKHYVGIYAWDATADDMWAFTALVPRPNVQMIDPADAFKPDFPSIDWMDVAKNFQLDDPVAAASKAGKAQPAKYELYVCRGNHSVIAGASKGANAACADISRLVYKMARRYLEQWGTQFTARSRVADTEDALRLRIVQNAAVFDGLGIGKIKTTPRCISSTYGRNPLAYLRLSQATGAPPTAKGYRADPTATSGWVSWIF